MASEILKVPAIGETFELTMNGNNVDPMEMIKKFDADIDCTFLGPAVKGIQTIRCKLIKIGSFHCNEFDEARKEITDLGYRPVEGQWMTAFCEKFPEPDHFLRYSNEIAFAGSEWKQNNDYAAPNIVLLTHRGVEFDDNYKNGSYAGSTPTKFVWQPTWANGSNHRWLVAEL